MTVYVPAVKGKLNVPSGLAFVWAAREASGLKRRIVTSLLEMTRPLITGSAGGVAVSAFPKMVSVSGIYKILSRELSPFETRARHSILVCPACKPLALKVKAVPLEVAFLPLLPAIARIKLPFDGPLIADTGSAPKRPETVKLLISIKPDWYVHVNSVLL